MGNCLQEPNSKPEDFKVKADKIEVIPPSEKALDSIPEYHGQLKF